MTEENKQIVVVDEKQQKVEDEICKLLQEGMWFQDACKMSGISKETGHRWRREDSTFDTRVETSILTFKRKMITAVTIGSLKNASHALEVLRVRWPNDWNVAKKVDLNGKIDAEISTIASNLQKLIEEGHIIDEQSTTQTTPLESGKTDSE